MFKLLLRGFSLENETGPGRNNARLIIGGTLLLLLLAMPRLPELLIGIWVDKYDPDFPLVPVFAIFMGGGLICVFLLVLLEGLLEFRRKHD